MAAKPDRNLKNISNMTLKKFNLEKKTALITGASGLLGKEHASALLELGAKVVLTDISEDNLISTKDTLVEIFDPELIIYEVMDVTNKKNITDVYKKLVKNEIRVDVLVNNAAIDPKVDKEEQ